MANESYYYPPSTAFSELSDDPIPYREERVVVTIPSPIPGVAASMTVVVPRRLDDESLFAANFPGCITCQCPDTLVADALGRRTTYVNICPPLEPVLTPNVRDARIPPSPQTPSSVQDPLIPPSPQTPPDCDEIQDGVGQGGRDQDRDLSTVPVRPTKGVADRPLDYWTLVDETDALLDETDALLGDTDVQFNFGCLSDECTINSALSVSDGSTVDAMRTLCHIIHPYVTHIERGANWGGRNYKKKYAQKCAENASLKAKIERLEQENARLRLDKASSQGQKVILDLSKQPTPTGPATRGSQRQTRKRAREASASSAATEDFERAATQASVALDENRTRIAALEQEVSDLKTELAAERKRTALLDKQRMRVHDLIFAYRTTRLEYMGRLTSLARDMEIFCSNVASWFAENHHRFPDRPCAIDEMEETSRKIMKAVINLERSDTLPSGFQPEDEKEKTETQGTEETEETQSAQQSPSSSSSKGKQKQAASSSTTAKQKQPSPSAKTAKQKQSTSSSKPGKQKQSLPSSRLGKRKQPSK